jgi:dihydroneopterin aldolase
MNYITSITGLAFYAFHGLYREERIIGANFKVDVKVVVEIKTPISTLENATNYELIYSAVEEEMAIAQDLIETVAQNILIKIKQHFPQAERVEVTIHKPNPAGVFKSGIASVTISQ